MCAAGVEIWQGSGLKGPYHLGGLGVMRPGGVTASSRMFRVG